MILRRGVLLFATAMLCSGTPIHLNVLGYPSDTDYCACDDSYASVWLNIVLVIDSTEAMTPFGLNTAWSSLAGLMTQMSLGSNSHQTQLGLVVYASEAKTVKQLGEINSVDELSTVEVPYLGGIEANLDLGLKLAAKMLYSSQQRNPSRNARKVIVVIASAFNAGMEHDPMQIASQFREDGGTIITIDYVQALKTPQLASIASPGFAFSSIDEVSFMESVLNSFCRVNCFCPSGYEAYSYDEQGIPNGGCVRRVHKASNYQTASDFCRQQGANLAIVREPRKEQFLHSLARGARFWIDPFTMAIGDDMRPHELYRNWAGVQGGLCVLSQHGNSSNENGWQTGDCRGTELSFFCETRPCSASHYC